MAREMKDSGIKWIGEIPIDWGITSLKHLCKMRAGKTLTSEQISQEGRYPVYGGNGIRGFYEEFNNEGTYLLVGRQGALCGNVHKVEGRFWATEHAVIVCINNNCDIDYMYYILIGLNLNQYASNTAAQPGLAVNTILNVKTCIVQRGEQQKIALFLSRKCAELDNVLEKTRASIEEYKKLKQAVITQAVTKGVRGNREMKDSGSVWFETIPSSWDMRKIKYIFKIQKDIAGEEGHTVLSITQKGIKPKDLSKNEGQLAENYSNYQLVHIGDFAMNHMDLLTGWVDVSKHEGVTSPDYRVFGLIDKDNYCSQYYLYLMQMCYTNRIFYGLGQGVSGLGRWRLQADKFLNFSITVPSYEEQKEIANYLDPKCSAIDELIAKKEQYLSEIENYKKSLIYEYVTGKKEV